MRAAVEKLLRRLDLKVTRYSKTVPARRLRMLTFKGVTDLLDVGANEGQYASALRASGFSGHIFSYEPLAGPFAVLQKRAASDPRWHPRRVAVGASGGELELNVSRWTLFSSALPMLDKAAQAAPDAAYVGAETVPMDTLDHLVEQDLGDRPAVLGLKVDVQGFEKEVLAGARDTLEKVEFVEVELSLVPVYAGEAGFQEMTAWVLDQGFELALTEPVFTDHESGRALQLNGMFLRA